jgi:methylthioribose-1-phosphate isomerase
MIRPIVWSDDSVVILDQRTLPIAESYLHCTSIADLAEAIRTLAIRGAPALGIAGAMGIALAAQTTDTTDLSVLRAHCHEAGDLLRATRPTAVNLAWGIEQLLDAVAQLDPSASLADWRTRLVAGAQQILEDDIAMGEAIGRHGAPLFPDGTRVLTHCNAGVLATGGAGTALAPIYHAAAQGAHLTLFADETRPLLQGARLTAWELQRAGIPTTLITDNMAGALMGQRKIDAVIVGADRIAHNGDVANKIGTYGLAVLAHHHQIPFYVAAPDSTVDHSTPSGENIPIENRTAREVTHIGDQQIAPTDITVWNPAFDVTPATLITAIITNRGIRKQVKETTFPVSGRQQAVPSQ